ncbi:MAG: H-type lectin domain-containing protein [Gemmobacter sp.]
MQRMDGRTVGVAQGSVMLFSDFADGGPMWTGSGPREVRRRVRFDEAFETAPAVMVGVSLWDLDRETNMRADVSAEKVTARGFELVFRTWGDTRVARIRADWMAIGRLHDDDIWTVT